MRSHAGARGMQVMDKPSAMQTPIHVTFWELSRCPHTLTPGSACATLPMLLCLSPEADGVVYYSRMNPSSEDASLAVHQVGTRIIHAVQHLAAVPGLQPRAHSID